MEPKIKIRKVSVEAILKALDDLFGKGVDYVDICQEEGKEDVIIFQFSKDYIDEQYHKNFEEVPDSNQNIETKLTKEGLDELLS